jgi:hypothetical protein
MTSLDRIIHAFEKLGASKNARETAARAREELETLRALVADGEKWAEHYHKKADGLEAKTAALVAKHNIQYKALVDLFQACSTLCLEDMDKLEAEINAASAAIGKAGQP